MNELEQNSQGLATRLPANVRTFINDNPWAAIVALVLLLGLIGGLAVRPGARR